MQKRTGYAPPGAPEEVTPPKPPTPAQLEKWFKLIRTKLTGWCGCGCGLISGKDDDKKYKGSCCHIFPKNRFFSVATHPLNYVERAMFGGCHGNMDDRGMDHWPNMADWPVIRTRFFVLEPLLTAAEKKIKFYTKLKTLVDAHP